MDYTNFSREQLEQEVTRLREQANAKKAQSISFKVSEKGAVSVYGLQRLPVTLYGEQWERLIVEKGAALIAFIRENRSHLARKSVAA